MTKEEKINEYNKKIEYCQSVISKYTEKIAEYNQSIVNVEEELNVLEDIVYKYDYDGDGIVSIIDLCIINLALVHALRNDPKYDDENKTYNGKSLDIFNDDNDNMVDIMDVTKMSDILGMASNYLDVTLNIKHSKEVNNFISSYYNNNNCWPTLEQVHDYDNSITDIDNLTKELLDKYDYDGDGIISLIDYNIIKLVLNGVIEDNAEFKSNGLNYDSVNMTLNGKSINVSVNNDNTISISDAVGYNNKIINYIENIPITIDLTYGIKLYNFSNRQDAEDWIKNYVITNKKLPTLEEFSNYVPNNN